jgi:heme/copper-type cytochrome/quinol oxidase subunit 3
MSELRFGFNFALIAFFAAVGYSIVQVLQVLEMIHWPWDETLIYGFSLVIAWPFMLAMLALHRRTNENLKLWSGAAMLFAAIYATYVVLMYAVQLGTALPLKLAGRPNALFAVDRYSLFWAIDGLGYPPPSPRALL